MQHICHDFFHDNKDHIWRRGIFSTGRPYHAHRRAAVNGSLIIHHSGLWPAEAMLFTAPSSQSLSLAPVREVLAPLLGGFPFGPNGFFLGIPSIQLSNEAAISFLPLILYWAIFFDLNTPKLKKVSQFFQNSFFSPHHCCLLNP